MTNEKCQVRHEKCFVLKYLGHDHREDEQGIGLPV